MITPLREASGCTLDPTVVLCLGPYGCSRKGTRGLLIPTQKHVVFKAPANVLPIQAKVKFMKMPRSCFWSRFPVVVVRRDREFVVSINWCWYHTRVEEGVKPFQTVAGYGFDI